MKGYIRVASANPVIYPADIKHNYMAILDMMKKASANKSAITVFSELSLSGATCLDLFDQEILLSKCKLAIIELAKATKLLDGLFVIGAPVRIKGHIFSMAVLMGNGMIYGMVPKRYEYQRDSINSHRYFSNGIDIYEELPDYALNNSKGELQIPCASDRLEYRIKGLAYFDFILRCGFLDRDYISINNYRGRETNILAVLSAIPADATLTRKITYYAQNKSRINRSGLIFSNAGSGESSTDYVFDGKGLIIENGSVLASQIFTDDIIFADLDLDLLKAVNNRTFRRNRLETNKIERIINFKCNELATTPNRKYSKLAFLPDDKDEIRDVCENIFIQQKNAILRRMDHIGTTKTVLGISGGLDSTMTLLALVSCYKDRGLDLSDIIAVSMPGFGSTSRTSQNAFELANSLGVTYKKISIEDSIRQHFKDIDHDENDRNVTYENAQARERTQILMDIANDVNGLCVATGDLSEVALGFCTYNGDHMGMYGVNAGLPKSVMREVVRQIAKKYDFNGESKIANVLMDIVVTPISPELLPSDNDEMAQKTEEIVGSYELNDFFLYYFIGYGFAPRKIITIAHLAFQDEYSKKEILTRFRGFIQRFFNNQYKRSCSYDAPKLLGVSLSPRGAFNMPSDSKCLLWEEELDQIEIEIDNEENTDTDSL